MDFDLVLAGTLVTPQAVVPQGWVAVRDELVQALGQGAPPAARERHVFPTGLILPGCIDAQTHSLSQADQEDFPWSTRAAAAGGVTTLVDMPYDEGALICSAAALTAKARHVQATARVDVALYGTIDPAEGPARVAEQVAAGAAAFKFSTFGTDPKRFPRIPPLMLAQAFAAIAPTGLTAGVHNEDHEAVMAAMAAVAASGITDWRAHGLSRPPAAELMATAQVYALGALTGCPAHIVHGSLAEGYRLAAAYRAAGHAATMECCIHYLVLAEDEDLPRLQGMGKINPPVRSAAEREALWRELAAGRVTLVSTDHVAWAEDRKTRPDMLANSSGVPGLEVMLPLFVAGALARGIPLTWAARLMAQNPARHFRLDHVKGALTPGREADIVVMEPRPYRYDPAASGHTIVSWSPYAGLTLPYAVSATWLRGTLVFDGREVLLAAPGQGRFQRPPPTLPLPEGMDAA